MGKTAIQQKHVKINFMIIFSTSLIQWIFQKQKIMKHFYEYFLIREVFQKPIVAMVQIYVILNLH